MVDITETKEIINKRIEQLNKKSKHYVIDMGSDEEFEEIKGKRVYHKAGKGRDYCSACERIKELKKLLNVIE